MKTYKKPTSIQIELTTESYMMDGSNPPISINPDGPVVGGDGGGGGDEPIIEELTRQQSIWDHWKD